MSTDFTFHVSEGKIVAFQLPDGQPVYFTEPHTLEQAPQAGQKVEEFRKTYQMSASQSYTSKATPTIVKFLKGITSRQREDFVRPLVEAGKKGVPKSSLKDQGPALAGLQATMTIGLEGYGLKPFWEKYYAVDGEQYYRIKEDYLNVVREAMKLV